MPTTNKGLRYPSSSAAPNVPQDIQNLASDVNTRMSTILGSGHYAAVSGLVLAGFPSWTDVATVTATSTGNKCYAQFWGVAFNGNSGADRDVNWRVLCDGAVIGQFLTIPVLLANLPRISRFASFDSTPAAGSHTWKLQASGPIASAVVVESGLLTITEQ